MNPQAQAQAQREVVVGQIESNSANADVGRIKVIVEKNKSANDGANGRVGLKRAGSQDNGGGGGGRRGTKNGKGFSRLRSTATTKFGFSESTAGEQGGSEGEDDGSG